MGMLLIRVMPPVIVTVALAISVQVRVRLSPQFLLGCFSCACLRFSPPTLVQHEVRPWFRRGGHQDDALVGGMLDMCTLWKPQLSEPTVVQHEVLQTFERSTQSSATGATQWC